MSDFNPGAIVKVFNEHGVEYVVIGAFAAIAQRAPIVATTDIDFVPSASRENLERLSFAIRDLDAKIRVDAEDVGFAFDPSPDFLAGMKMLNLVCDFGDFDLVFEPAGFSGYEALTASALTITVGTNQVTVASLADVIKSKELVGRRKDLEVLDVLKRFLGRSDPGHEIDS